MRARPVKSSSEQGGAKKDGEREVTESNSSYIKESAKPPGKTGVDG